MLIGVIQLTFVIGEERFIIFVGIDELFAEMTKVSEISKHVKFEEKNGILF